MEKEKKRILLLLLILMLLSVANIFFAKNIVDSYSTYFIKQLLWYTLGFVIIYVISKLNVSIIFKYSFYFYLLGNFLLLLTLLIGKDINGAKGWLFIGPFSFQPSEFMKIFLILYLREFTIKYKLSDFKYLILLFLIIFIPSILTFLEPDTGGVLIYFIIWFVFLFLKKLNKWYYIVLFGGFFSIIIGFLILYYGFQDIFIKLFGSSFFYRMDRITNFLKGQGYQITMALTSISNSGLFGIKTPVYFPEGLTDFALTLLISNFGIIGLIITLIIYSYLFYNLIKFKSDKYLLYSMIFVFFFQYIINNLMNVSLFPIIGITLPFLSYGGSSLLSYFILIGFILKEKVSYDTYL